MTHSPFGPAVATCGGRRLGAWFAAAAIGSLREASRWERAALGAVAIRSWQGPAGTVDDRSRKI
eukprot:1006500-Lingulodinium_polyedra.AAC.1